MAHAKKNQALLLFVRRQEYRRRLEDKERWGHVGGRIYTIAKIFYIIGFLCVIIINLGYIIGLIFSEISINSVLDATQNSDQYSVSNLAASRSSLYLVSVMSCLLLAGFVLLLCKKHLAALVCTALPVAPLLAHFYHDLADQINNGEPSRYLLFHVLPLALMLVTAIIMFIINVKEKRAENAAYDKLAAAIYKKHAKEEGVMGQEEWEELLNKYAEGSGLKGTRKEDA